jgi:hypothetical protein
LAHGASSRPSFLCFASSFHPPLQVNEGSFLKKSLFHWGYNRKLHFLQKGHTYDKVG